jgi:hypothetical protein
MKMLNKIPLLFFALLCVLGSNAFSQEVTLRYNLQENQKYKLNVVSHQVIEQDLGGIIQTITNLMESNLAITVTSVGEDSISMDVMYKNLHLEVEGPMGESMIMSSEGSKSDPINQMMKKLIDQPIQVIINPRGEVMSVEGVNEIMDNLLVSLEDLDRDQQESLRASLDHQFGKESFKSSFLSGLVIYPERALSVGERWSCERDGFSSVPLSTETTWVLNRVRRQRAHLDGLAILQSYDEENGNEVVMEGTQEIQAVVDMTTGWMTESTQKSEIYGSMILPPNEYFDESVEVPLHITTITRTVLK